MRAGQYKVLNNTARDTRLKSFTSSVAAILYCGQQGTAQFLQRIFGSGAVIRHVVARFQHYLFFWGFVVSTSLIICFRARHAVIAI